MPWVCIPGGPFFQFLPTAKEGNVFTRVCHSVHNQSHCYSITLSQRGQYASYWNAFLLPAAMKLGQGNIFTPVCDSVNRRGCVSGLVLGVYLVWSQGVYLVWSQGCTWQTLPQTRYTPWTRYPLPLPQTRYTPLPGPVPPGTRYTPQTRYTPRPGTPPWTRYTPQTRYPPGPGTPPDQVHPLGPGTPPGQGTPPRTRYTLPQYASYWNAFLFKGNFNNNIGLVTHFMSLRPNPQEIPIIVHNNSKRLRWSPCTNTTGIGK